MVIYRVIKIFLNPEEMEIVNVLTEIDAFETDNWVDYYTFEECEKLKSYVEKEELEALKHNEADFIVFRLGR